MGGKVIFTTASFTGEMGTDADGNLFVNTSGSTQGITFNAGAFELTGSKRIYRDPSSGEKIIKFFEGGAEKIQSASISATGIPIGSFAKEMNISTDISGSFTSTGSFGRLEATTMNVTNTVNLITSDANDRVLTAKGDGSIQAEAKLSFNGNNLTVTGDIASVVDINATGNVTASGNISASGALSTFGEIVHLEGTDPRLKLKAKGANHPGIEWHEDSTRKWVLYNDPDENDKLVFKNDDTELVKINQAGATEFPSHITASGNISASGNIRAGGTITAEQLTSTDDLTIAGNINIANNIVHTLDADTNIGFAADKITFTAGNEVLLTLQEGDASSRDIVTIGDGGDVDFKVRTNGDDNAIFVQGSSDNVGIGKTAPNEKLEVVGNISASGDIFNTQFVQMTNSSSVINTFNTSSFQTCKYLLQVTSASKIQSSEMLVVQNSSNAFNSEYAQINSGLNLVNFTTDVNNSNVRLLGNGSFISCSVKFIRTLI